MRLSNACGAFTPEIGIPATFQVQGHRFSRRSGLRTGLWSRLPIVSEAQLSDHQVLLGNRWRPVGRGGPIPPRIDPQDIFDSLFGSVNPDDGAAADRARRPSILDFVDRRYETLAMRRGSSDRAKLDAHLAAVRRLETTLQGMTDPGNAACRPPTRVDTTGYNPAAGLNADDGGQVRDSNSDTMIPEVGKFMMDMLVMALACDMTGVATLQWSDTEAKHTFPWLSLSEHHHCYQHDGGFRSDECAQICRWYSEQHAYLLQQMALVDMGGHTLLDESVVFVGSEILHPSTHTKTAMPFLLAGGGGGLRGDRFLSSTASRTTICNQQSFRRFSHDEHRAVRSNAGRCGQRRSAQHFCMTGSDPSGARSPKLEWHECSPTNLSPRA